MEDEMTLGARSRRPLIAYVFLGAVYRGSLVGIFIDFLLIRIPATAPFLLIVYLYWNYVLRVCSYRMIKQKRKKVRNYLVAS